MYYFEMIKASFRNLKAYRDLKKYKLNFSHEKIDNDIRKEFYANKEIEVKNTLSQTLIEDFARFSKDPFPLKALKEEIRIEYVYQLEGASEKILQRYRGIGPKNSRTIMKTYRSFKEELLKEKTIKLVDTKESKKLLLALYTKKFYLDNEKEINEHEEQIKETRKRYRKRFFSDLGKSTIFFWYYFVDRSVLDNTIKDSKEIDYSNIINSYNMFNDKYSNASISDEFNKNISIYYSYLDSLWLTRSTGYGYIPKDLVDKIESIDLNYNTLKVIPRKYQEFGAKYMISQRNTLIGDEMGLGKTIEALVAINHLYQNGHKYFVVTCPLSILSNWKREVEKWTTIPAYEFYGKGRNSVYRTWQQTGGFLILNYEKAEELNTIINKTFKIDVLVVDEAHYIKNPEALRTKSVYNLKKRSNFNIFMTGTPLENNVEEMVELLQGLNPGLSLLKNKSHLKIVNKMTFKEDIAPFYLRRNREDVLSELPEKEEKELWVPFSDKEYEAYKLALQETNFMVLRRVAWSGENALESPKIAALLEICEEAKRENRKVLVFSFFLEVVDKVYKLLGEASCGPITGSVSGEDRQKIIDEFTETKDFAVLVAQIGAGGIGLNIQAASVVILCEPQWKPSTEEQAISRSYRMGQVNKVLVYRLLTENSVDERILNIIYKKSKIFDEYAKTAYISTQSDEAVNASNTLINDIMTQEKEYHKVK